jgi:hypothetical protein
MRSVFILIALLCAFIFGAMGAQSGYTYSTIIPFVVSLSVLAYLGLTSQQKGGPISFDRLTHF